MAVADAGVAVEFIATLVGTTGATGTMAADEQAANTSIKLQLRTALVHESLT